MGPGTRPRLLLVGERPYRPDDVAAVVEASAMGALADDARGAAALAGRGGVRGAARSQLARPAVVVSERLVRLADFSRGSAVDEAGARVGDERVVRP